ncbi:MAG: PQQ-binding-like beta-propeller repeat protein [Candidatus Bathyarchaeota archaeon]|nr:PQQ-binding-like beta-propeller repeat protein [Candidatus Bathyarchaeota archaeon]
MKRFASRFILLFILCSALVSLPKINIARAEPETIVVPDDYPTIIAAIGNASEGDTVFVKKGTYQGNLIIDKSLLLIGEDSRTTTIVGVGTHPMGWYNTISVNANGVTISGFTINETGAGAISGINLHCNRTQITDNNINTYYGIIAVGSHNNITENNLTHQNTVFAIDCSGSFNTISLNNIINVNEGIELSGSFNTVAENSIIGTRSYSIILENGDSNTIARNNIADSYEAFALKSGSYNIVFGNNVTASKRYAIWVHQLDHSIIYGNHIADNPVGISLTGTHYDAENNTFYNNNFVNNDQHVAVLSGYVNYWDNGYPSGGNYWDDYNGDDINQDGIGDFAYEIAVYNRDFFPYMAPINFSDFSTWNEVIHDKVDWWPMFQHDLGHRGHSISTAPNTNNTLWNYITDGDVQSSPVVADGKVYIGSNDGNIICLNAVTGTRQWNYTTGGSVQSSPAIAYGKVYVGSHDGKVYALNAVTGALLWSYPTGGSVKSSPAVAEGRVHLGSTDGEIYTLNAETGALLWNYTTGGAIESSPAVADGKVVEQYEVVSVKFVYVGSNDGKFYCLNGAKGYVIWIYSGYGGGESSPAVVDGQVYVGSKDGTIYCLRDLQGSFRWNYTTGGCVNSSPAIAYGKVYVGSHDGNIYCLNATTGVLQWNYTTGGGVESSPAVADGKVYVGSNDGNIYCLNTTTGALVWSHTGYGGGGSSPVVADGKVYIGSRGGEVNAFGDAYPTFAWPTDSAGNSQSAFKNSENVYVKGQGFPSITNVTIYLIPDGAEPLPDIAIVSVSTTTTPSGDLPVTLVWSQPLTLGKYDIWIDLNKNKLLDEEDVWSPQAISFYLLAVIPEFPSLTPMLLILIVLAVALAIYKLRLPKTPSH